jgi:hypothetical protein
MTPAKATRKAASPTKKPKAAAKKATKKAATPSKATKAATKKATPPKFGRTGTAGKAEGDGAVKAWIAGIKPEHQEIAHRFDALAGETLPGVKRAVKWNAPFYGLPGKGWVATMGSFKEYVSIGFFAGAKLTPAPPLGESGSMRRVTLHSAADYDERQLRAWLKQASDLQGWGKV